MGNRGMPRRFYLVSRLEGKTISQISGMLTRFWGPLFRDEIFGKKEIGEKVIKAIPAVLELPCHNFVVWSEAELTDEKLKEAFWEAIVHNDCVVKKEAKAPTNPQKKFCYRLLVGRGDLKGQ